MLHRDLYETDTDFLWEERRALETKGTNKAQKALENSSIHCPTADGRDTVGRAVLQADPSRPQIKYRLPPTEIHDGRLFRKVG
ncbi:hypothetical protein BDU57DRAFT_508968 [Ampelomyces quisqualis]|uniref:Uncharacterized protein n=1 Tax=Ampelomyces quisqualis TaxID=50730 RepID=A0A6A5R1C9_AMPQU|nr:hypothetical protein BDU57DRAFT_508968 [Ampelomyces quisqualis]